MRNIKNGKFYLAAMQGRRVAFGGVTEYRFALGYGGSAIPVENGPAIGLVGSPMRIRCRPIKSKKRPLQKYTRDERVEILKSAGYDMKDIVDFCMDALDVRLSRNANLRPKKRPKQSPVVQRNTALNAAANIDYLDAM
ncbi:hypothetical protein Ae201684P_007981 [Aphanomyces euteiches]|uniref:Uncharacterized protein n=1 Tax=Aphanomyces euteiches TaxID=100861 RepID=A0A6G0WM91_9STRA|nr:hypothetical protein Ae201684_013782 [Aphanomyces euteiches]KAH9080895.1 hypothetical protein Ae201684P_007981 [Aphanomyces euteiches]